MPGKFVRQRRVIAFLVAAAALMAGAPAAHAATKIKATELEPIPNPSLSYNLMAQTMGLFAKHNLVPELGPNLQGGGPARVQAVVTGATDVATSDIIAVMGGVYSGAKVKILMVMTPYGDEEVWGTNRYKTMKSAEGQEWAVASLGGAQRFNAQMAVEGMGLPANAYRWIAISGGDGPHVQALVTGRVQLASISHIGAELAIAKGYTSKIHVLMPHTAKYTPPVPRLVVIAGSEWIKKHEAVATDYVETMLQASRDWEDNANSWVKPAEKIFSKSGLDAKQLHTAWSEFRAGGYFSVHGGVNFAATPKVLDLFFKLRHENPNRYLSKTADIYDTGPLRTALNKMGIAKGTPGLPDNPDWYKGAK